MSLGKFLTKHVGELKVVAEAISIIASVLPLKKKDEARVLGALETITNAAASIEAALPKIQAAEALTKADIEKLIASTLAKVIEEEIEKALSKKSLVDKLGKLFK